MSAQGVLVDFCVDLESIILQCTATLDAHDNLVYACAASPNSPVIASASLDTTVKL